MQCWSTTPCTEPQPSKEPSKEPSTTHTTVHVPEPATSSSTPPPSKPRARRVDAVAEELAEGQCSSGDPRPPKAPRHVVSDAQEDGIVDAARRVSKHVYKRLLPQLNGGVTDAQLAEEAHGMCLYLSLGVPTK